MMARSRLSFDYALGGVSVDVIAELTTMRRAHRPEVAALDCWIGGQVFDPDGLYVRGYDGYCPLIDVLEEKAIEHLFGYPET